MSSVVMFNVENNKNAAKTLKEKVCHTIEITYKAGNKWWEKQDRPPNTHTHTLTYKYIALTHTKRTCVWGAGYTERGHCLLSAVPQHCTACLTSNKAIGKGKAAAPVSNAAGVSKQLKGAAVWRLQGPGWHTWRAQWPGGLGTLARHWHTALCRWLPMPF